MELKWNFNREKHSAIYLTRTTQLSYQAISILVLEQMILWWCTSLLASGISFEENVWEVVNHVLPQRATKSSLVVLQITHADEHDKE